MTQWNQRLFPMHQVLNKCIIKILLVAIVLVTCCSCKRIETYSKREYLSLLASKTGLSDNEDYLNDLLLWGVVENDELENLDEDLDYDFLSLTFARLLDIKDNYLEYLKEIKWTKQNKKENDLVDRKIADELIDKLVNKINNQHFERVYEYKTKEGIKEDDEYYAYDGRSLISYSDHKEGDILYLKEDDEYKRIINKQESFYILEDVELSDVYEDLNIANSSDLDFDKAIIIPGQELENDDSSYINPTKELLASNLSQVFHIDGFRVSYNVSGNGISAHISKNIKGVNTFFDVSVSDVKTDYKWDYEDGKLKEAYFKVAYQSTCELGVSIGRYKNYYLDFKDYDGDTFLNSLKSVVKEKDDELEASIRICEIKVPVAGVTSVYLNMELLIKIYISGKAEVVLTNRDVRGFEIKNGKLRLINDSDKDLDFIIGASAKTALGLNFNLEALNIRLMDIELDGGIRAEVKTTLHLYDEDGNDTSRQIDLPYAAIDEIAKENENVKVCGDLSLSWILDISLNTSKSLLYKFGLSYKKNILDKDNQLFGNMTHIENGVFIKNCTRKNRFSTSQKNIDEIDVEKILLEKYAIVIKINEKYNIPIKALPDGYKTNDLIFKSSDTGVASIENGVIVGKNMGACQVDISTKDNKYHASINVLVSTN